MSFSYELIVVLGGGVSNNNELPFWVIRRLDKALELYRRGKAPKLLMSGKGTTFGLTEAELMANYLCQKGIPKDMILLEKEALDTIQNAYFSRVKHIDPANIKSFMVITSKFQYWRSVDIFEWVFGDDYQISFEAASDEGITSEHLAKRAISEKKLREFNEQRLFRSIKAGDLKTIHNFIFDSSNRIARSYRKLGESMLTQMVLS